MFEIENQTTPRRPRAAKTTRNQYLLYLEQLKSNKAFRENKFDSTKPNLIEETWEKLIKELNSSGGPVRTVKEWKRIFTDWRSQTKRKARKFRTAQRETGNKDTTLCILTDIEETLMEIIGWVVVDGMPETPEFGLGISETTSKTFSATFSSNGTKTENKDPNVETQSNRNIGKATGNKTPGITPQPKRKKSVIGCLAEIVTQNEMKQNQSELFQEINSNLQKLVAIQTKQLQLQQLELKVKFPDMEFALSDDDDD